VKRLVGRPALPLRVGDYRVIFIEDDEFVSGTDIGPRGSIYE
jgi:mRNA-degrading endonuclease RelE of RelBE toxin-antitoxin system